MATLIQSCVTGDIALGGGFIVSDSTIFVLKNIPDDGDADGTADGWLVKVINTSTMTAGTFEVHVVCSTPAP